MPPASAKRPVKIIAGPLMGLQGTLLELMERDRAVVSVRIGERKVPVELDCNMIMITLGPGKKTAKKRSRRARPKG